MSNETTKTYSSTIPAPVDELLAWHRNPGALNRLMPPWIKVEIKETDGSIEPGSKVRLRVPLAGPVGTDWLIRHESLDDGSGFADIQQDGPFTSWRHDHRFLPDTERTSVLEDRLAYGLPAGPAGEAVAGGRISDMLDRMFAMRHLRTRNDLLRHRHAGLERPLRVAIAGSTGLVGQRLVPFLQGGGHEVFSLVRREARAANEISWDPAKGRIEAPKLEGMDAVVNLAGVSIAGGLWTEKRRAAIRNSRVQGTHLLATTMAGLSQPPRVFVATSAVGAYGSRGDETLTEESALGTGFLADVCREWEAAADPARDAGIRVVHPRFGVVFAGDGGMLPLLSLLFKTGLGGPLGDGRQYMSWIAADDLVGILLESIANDSLEGPVNAVSSQLTTNAEFTRAMGKVLKRPTFLRAPASVMRLVAGDLANDLILTSQRVVPERLDQAGFRFAFPTLESTLRFELGKGDFDYSGSNLPDASR